MAVDLVAQRRPKPLETIGIFRDCASRKPLQPRPDFLILLAL